MFHCIYNCFIVNFYSGMYVYLRYSLKKETEFWGITVVPSFPSIRSSDQNRRCPSKKTQIENKLHLIYFNFDLSFSLRRCHVRDLINDHKLQWLWEDLNRASCMWELTLSTRGLNRSSQRRCSVKISVLKNFTNFTGKYLCWNLFLIKLQGKRLQHRCFPVNLRNF